MAVYAGVEDKPLRLKDFLELDCDSCSAAGFRCYPRHLCIAGAAAASSAPMRNLLEASEAPRGFGRSPSLRRPSLSHLSRSLSRRFKGSFSWRRREDEAAPVAAVSSTCGSSSDSETSEAGSSSTERKSEYGFSSASSESLHACVSTAAAAAAGDEHEAMKGEPKEAVSGSSSEVDDKEQLSPVAVLDFPFDDDEDVVEEEERKGGSACSSSFSDNIAQLQKRKTLLQHKIRRFGSIGELGAVDLVARFASSDSECLGSVPVQEQRQCCVDATTAPPRPNDGDRRVNVYEDDDDQNLLGLLAGTVWPAGVDGVSERLLLDFFAETVQKLSTSENGEDGVRLARGWLEGTGARWGLKDMLGRREDLVAEMKRSWQWSARVVGEEEERNVGVVVAGLVIDELVGELVRDLLVYSCRFCKRKCHCVSTYMLRC